MAKFLRFALLLMFAVFAWVSAASAANILTAVIDVTTEDGFCTTPVPCSLDTGSFGSPATGSADFTPIGQPWTFDFTTGNASTSCGNFGPPQAPCPDGSPYKATFGSGGFEAGVRGRIYVEFVLHG